MFFFWFSLLPGRWPHLTDISVYFVQPESSKDDGNYLQHNQFNSGNKQCLKKIFYIHVTSHLYTSVLWGVGSLSHFWSETFRWAHVQQRFFHQMLNTDAQMGGSRKQVWLLYTRGYGYTLFKRVCKWMVANGFVNHKNPKCNPSGFHEIGGQMATVDILATIDTVYWSRKLQEDMGAQSLWGVCYASSCMFENQCLAEVEGLKSDPKKFQL